MKAPYRTVLCGLGNIAWRLDQGRGLSHASAFEGNPRTALRGGCSPDREDREAFEEATGLPAFEQLNDLIDAIRGQFFRPDLHIFGPVHELSGNRPRPAIKGGRKKQGLSFV